MNLNKRKLFNIQLSTLIFAVLLLFVYLTGVTYAWFTTSSSEGSVGNVADVKVALLDTNNNPLTNQSIVYSRSDGDLNDIIVPLQIKAQSVSPGSTIDAIIRIMIYGEWSDGLQYYDSGAKTFTYQYDTVNWTETAFGIGFDYVYYNTKLAPGQTVNFLTSITFPVLPELYNGKSVNIGVYIEAMQGNYLGVSKWSGESPTGWNPLGV